MRFFLLISLLSMSCATLTSISDTSAFTSAYEREVVDGEIVHLLSVDLTRYMIRPIRAEPLATLINLSNNTQALAAINGGFFQADGTPAGLLMIDKKIHGYQGKPRAALGWNATNDDVVVDRVLYTKGQREFISATGLSTTEQWTKMDFAIGGTPLLVHEYKVMEGFDAEKVREQFLSLKHARSAVCVKNNKHWIFVAVEGSSSLQTTLPHFSRNGLTMYELARFMADTLHCRYAINLDGGGSTALVIDGRLVNETTFGEREISDALAVFDKEFRQDDNRN